MTNDELIKEEIDSMLADIRKLYEKEGKKVSGQFSEGLEAVYTPNKATIRGYVYLAGRKAGKMPPVEALKSWIQRKGIFNVKGEAQLNSLAFAIAKKIAKKGTSKEYELKVYEEVITPERIQQIYKRVAQLNVNRLITEVRAQLEVLAKNV